jgi:hypothetical protein
MAGHPSFRINLNNDGKILSPSFRINLNNNVYRMSVNSSINLRTIQSGGTAVVSMRVRIQLFISGSGCWSALRHNKFDVPITELFDA